MVGLTVVIAIAILLVILFFMLPRRERETAPPSSRLESGRERGRLDDDRSRREEVEGEEIYRND